MKNYGLFQQLCLAQGKVKDQGIPKITFVLNRKLEISAFYIFYERSYLSHHPTNETWFINGSISVLLYSFKGFEILGQLEWSRGLPEVCGSDPWLRWRRPKLPWPYGSSLLPSFGPPGTPHRQFWHTSSFELLYVFKQKSMLESYKKISAHEKYTLTCVPKMSPAE